MRARGAEVVLVGDSYSDAQAHCDRARRRDRADVHPSVRRSAGDRRPGHGRRRDRPPSPGRSAARGVRAGRRRRADRRHRRLHQGACCPNVRVIGVEPFESDAMYQSLAGRPPRHARSRRHLRRRRRGAHRRRAYRSQIAQLAVDEIVRVSNDEMCAAIKDIFDDTRSVMEPAGALAVAGLKRWVAAHGLSRRASGRGPERRQHELRSAALRRRARRARRRARGAASR